ncbi:MAG: DUF192 domain-containing protein [Candidatus Nomurabacteria bacterium]
MHIRSKKNLKPGLNDRSISRLIFSIVIVFIMLGLVFSLGNIGKSRKLDFNFLSRFQDKFKKQEVATTTSMAWILNPSKILKTNDGQEIYIQIASTSQEEADGLSWKDQLKVYNQNGKINTEGMLFDFKFPKIENFWMKDMNFDLDMIWLDSNYKIVHIEKNALASSYNKEDPNSSQIFSNDNDHLAQYVLEINAGLVDKMNLKEGDTLITN